MHNAQCALKISDRWMYERAIKSNNFFHWSFGWYDFPFLFEHSFRFRGAIVRNGAIFEHIFGHFKIKCRDGFVLHFIPPISLSYNSYQSFRMRNLGNYGLRFIKPTHTYVFVYITYIHRIAYSVDWNKETHAMPHEWVYKRHQSGVYGSIGV